MAPPACGIVLGYLERTNGGRGGRGHGIIIIRGCVQLRKPMEKSPWLLDHLSLVFKINPLE